MSSIRACIFLFAIFSLVKEGICATFVASVDKTTVEAGGSFTLILTYHDKTNNEPDLSVLENDFLIESKETHQETQIINGRLTAKTSFILQLSPKSTSVTITIPSISLGSEKTEKVILTQEPSQQRKDIVINSNVDVSSAYVNQEIILTITIKTSLPIFNASLNVLDIKDAIVEELKSDEPQSIIEQGISYQVLTKKYSIFPTKAQELTIPPVRFTGMVKQNPSPRRWQSFFNNGQRISAQSLELTVPIKEVPSSYPKNQPFLPVKNLVIIETDEANYKFMVGKPFIRKFEMKAKGTLVSFLPEFSHPQVEHLSIYPESTKKTQKNLSEGMDAKLDFAFTYIPTESGDMVVPKQIVYWWDVENDKLKEAEIRELAIKIEGDGLKKALPLIIKNEANKAETKKEANSDKNEDYKSVIYWLGIFGLLVVIICILFLSVVIRKNYVQKHPKIVDFKSIIKKIFMSCRNQNLHEAYVGLQNLHAWALKFNELAIAQKIEPIIKELEYELYSKTKDKKVNELCLYIKETMISVTLSKEKGPIFRPLYPD